MVKAAGTVHGIDVVRVEQAIRAAERLTSGELRVAVSKFYFWGDVQRAARTSFRRLGMHRTRKRNGVLIFVAPRLRRFAFVADTGVDAQIPAPFWTDLVVNLRRELSNGDLTEGLEGAIRAIGERLASAFPFEPSDENELADRVVT